VLDAHEKHGHCAWTGVPRALNGSRVELLTYLPSRMSNADLATLCFVSVNTIKGPRG